MKSGWEYIGIFLYIMVNILDKQRCHSVRCYVCDYCPIVTSVSISEENNCTSCSTAGYNYSIHRICVFKDGIPINFPNENRTQCNTDLCNGLTVDNTGKIPSVPIANPFRCYTCLNCTKSNQKVLSGCGACVTTRGSGIISKFCGTTCERLYIDDQISCCSTDLCNGMTKLSIHRHVIIVLFVCIGISKYIL
ncbi:putative sm29 [Schistosoma mansoni]|uniref:Sm29 n=1 Tax=Schistosoma mansoni TaxID=6183 RepID=O96368_SCHMA|nr:putative sm29 [Schistosoma mansoni]AAC98911.1 Sm29 [Schistosoma mansoni]|eukprot:XP_018649159.1 putative sm29 [Schistosoma mansoni]